MNPFETLLDEAGAALDDGRFDEALQKSDAALELQPADVEARATRAAALGELGRSEEADAAFAKLIADDPSDPTWKLWAARVMILQNDDDPDRAEAGLQLLEKLDSDEDDRLEFERRYLNGIALNQLGELDEALEAIDGALELFGDDADARVERAVILFELGRFDAALPALESLSRELPDDPMPRHYLGLLAERRGDDAAAQAYFSAATQLDSEAFPPAVSLSEPQFDAAVKAAIAQLPPHAKAELGNTTICVEPFPDDEALSSGEVTPTILGVFQGTPLDERSPLNAEDHRTAMIVLYQRNLERFAKTRDELIEQIGITLLHEVGHLLGLDEAELRERGLD